MRAEKSTKGNHSKKLNSKKPFPLGAVLLLTLLSVTLIYLLFRDYFFEGTAKLSDLIIDQIALEASNKTGEWEFFWGLLWIGCFICLALFSFRRKLWSTRAVSSLSADAFSDDALSADALSDDGNSTVTSYETNCKQQLSDTTFRTRIFPCLLCFFPPLIQLIFYGGASLYLWLFALTAALLLFFARQDFASFGALFLFLYFDIQAAAVIAARFGLLKKSSDLLFFILAALLFILFLFLCKKVPSLLSSLLFFSQLPLPLLLLLYTKNTYSYQGTVLRLSYPKAYLCFIGIFILALYAAFFLQYRRTKKQKSKCLISITSAISIFLYGSYIPGALMVQTDMHHHGEQLLPFFQIAVLKNTAYDGYSPVSGLFPMLIGGINQFLFGGKATTYAAAFTVLFLLFGALTIIMISLHVDARQTLLFAFLFHMPVYCRTWMILPVLLLLLLPAVLKNKRRFLYVYVFCGFLSGLYYPLFGLALITAVLPYALYALFSLLKEKELSAELKQKHFYIETLFLFIPIICAIPLLIRMASHILAYSHQTLLADGLSLSSASLPDWFLPWLSFLPESIRGGIYEAVRFLGGMLPVWLFLLLLLTYLSHNRLSHPWRQPAFLGLSVGFIILPVCYTYTMVIMDEAWVSRLFSRSSHVYLWILGIFLPILLIRFGKQILQSKTTLSFLFAAAVSVPFLTFYRCGDYQFPALNGTRNADCACIGEYSANLAAFPVSPSMVPISETDTQTFPQLGYGFIDNNTKVQLEAYKTAIDQLRAADSSLRLLGLDRAQMYYFLLNESALYSGKVSLAKSYETALHVISTIDSHTIIGNDLQPLNNYYIYRYLLNSGYVHDSATGFYLPKELYISLYGSAAYEQKTLADSPWAAPSYISSCAKTLGDNLTNLLPLLTETEHPSEFLYTELDLQALSAAFGNNLDENTIMTISWGGTGCLLTDLADGKLLLPLDSNADWAVSDYSQVYISLYDEQKPVSEISFKIPIEQVSLCLQYYSLKDELIPNGK